MWCLNTSTSIPFCPARLSSGTDEGASLGDAGGAPYSPIEDGEAEEGEDDAVGDPGKGGECKHEVRPHHFIHAAQVKHLLPTHGHTHRMTVRNTTRTKVTRL